MIRSPFQKKLYAFTKPKHIAVESIFNFREGINTRNISLFHGTMLAARSRCAAHLENLDSDLSVQTHNRVLIQKLSEDSSEKDALHFLDNGPDHVLRNLNNPKNFSEQLGVFYVMAGSSAGAKILLNQVKVQNMKAPFGYLNHLTQTSQSQMIQLNVLLNNHAYEEEKVMGSAWAVFDLIYKIASYELKEATSKL